MAQPLSAGVYATEIDLTGIVPSVATTDGAIAGVFRWGPVNEIMLIDSEDRLVRTFGRPSNFNAETFFTAANFLAYSNRLHVVRVANTTATGANGALNAIANTGTVNTALTVVRNEKEYSVKDGTFPAGTLYVAKYPGEFGNSLRISVCDNANSFNNILNLTPNGAITGTLTVAVGANTGTISLASANTTLANTYATTLIATIADNDYIEVGNSAIGTQYLKVLTTSATPTVNSTHASFTLNFENRYTLSTDFSSNTVSRFWEFFNLVDSAPGTSSYVASYGNTAAADEMHVVVVDQGGAFTGTPGSVLEVFKGVSRATDARTLDDSPNYYKTVINNASEYIWMANDRSGAVSNTSVNIATSTATEPLNLRFVGGQDGFTEATIPLASLAGGYDMFASPEKIDISLIMQGRPRDGTNPVNGSKHFQLANYIIDNICEVRKDCIVFISPERDTVINNDGREANSLVAYANNLRSTSYGVVDTGYKYQYDRYNDVYRWVPLNGDLAGLTARTDDTNDAWWSPAGHNRGQIKNIVRLAFNPTQAERDIIYKNRINPVVSFQGQGTVLYGDKTLLSRPSAFDRINVRRLFIVLRKAISRIAQTTLFEFNDDFTRQTFKSLVNPYLRDIKGRRGITDFLVVCDSTNNTGQVIDRNEFIGDIYIKPARSINFVKLNFIAVRTDVSFNEVVGLTGAS